MSGEWIHRVREWVEARALRACSGQTPPPPAIALKLDHTRRVADNARTIARALGWAEDDVLLAEALGWLHDVGRFDQYAEFGHYHDATSFDHGRRGFEVVRQAPLLSPLPEPRRNALLEGIRHHNAKAIPDSVSPLSLPFLKLIRNADKLDIFRVVAEEIERDGFRELASLWPHIDLKGPVNPHLLREVRSQPTADIALLRSLADFLVLQISWVRDLNCAPSFALVRDRRLLDALATHLPADSAAQDYCGEMRLWLDVRAASHGRNASLCG